MKSAAWILLLLGLVVSSLATSKIDDELGVAALLTDPVFLLGVGMIAVSIVLNRRSVSRKTTRSRGGDLVLKEAKDALKEILDSLNRIAGQREAMPLSQVVAEVDTLLKNLPGATTARSLPRRNG